EAIHRAKEWINLIAEAVRGLQVQRHGPLSRGWQFYWELAQASDTAIGRASSLVLGRGRPIAVPVGIHRSCSLLHGLLSGGSGVSAKAFTDHTSYRTFKV